MIRTLLSATANKMRRNSAVSQKAIRALYGHGQLSRNSSHTYIRPTPSHARRQSSGTPAVRLNYPRPTSLLAKGRLNKQIPFGQIARSEGQMRHRVASCVMRALCELVRSGLLSRITCIHSLLACNDPTASFITTGIRLFTPSFIYMPTAKLPHKPFPNPARAAQSARKK
jgi:hypothetical protein